MITKNGQNVNAENAVECQFGNAIKELNICRLLKASNIRKKKGGSVFDIFQFLLLLVFQNCNLYHFLNSKKQDTAFSKNTYYRFLNDPKYILQTARIYSNTARKELGWRSAVGAYCKFNWFAV